MSIQLIFVRHGIAEDISGDHSDFSRRLTQKGKQKLEITLPLLLPFLNADPDRNIFALSDENRKRDQEREKKRKTPEIEAREVIVWSSPLIRAQETAKIAADIFRAVKIDTFDFIGEGYFNGFLNSIEEMDPSVERTIIVVGHEPHLGYWSKALCGAYLPFKKGAAAGFLYHKEAPGTADLQWFLQPESMTALSSKSESTQILSDIGDTLLTYLHQVQTERDAFLKAPHDMESAHQLRVSIRKLRSLLSFLKPFLRAGQNVFMQGILKKAVTEFSYLRELDVLLEACRAFGLENPGNMDADSVVFEKLDELRAQEARRTLGVVSAAASIDSLSAVEKEIRGIVWKKSILSRKNIDENESISNRINRDFTDMYEAFKKASASVDYYDAAATHALRIEAKKLRYVLQTIEPLTGRNFGMLRVELKDAHDFLGELCDARRNKDILQKFEGMELPERTREEIHAVIEYQNRIIEEKLSLLKR